ncbi:MAG: 30S ribosomal protein S20 [Pirellulales bacterium]
MPNTPSAKKRLKQNVERRARNRAAKTSIRNLTRTIRESLAAKDVAKSEEAFGKLVSKLDRASSAKVIHANAAARTKSRLSKAIKTIKSK